MAVSVDTNDVAGQLPDLLRRTEAAGERFVIERAGMPIAAIVPAADLASLPELQDADREEAWLQEMVVKGLISVPNPAVPLSFEGRPLIKVKGKPISETIIEDRGPR